MNDPVFATAHEIASAIRQRRIAAREVLEVHLSQIARHNPAVNAIVTLDDAGARELAQAADGALARNELWGPLHGVPVTLKDCLATAGMRTTAGYPPLVEYIPKEDSTVAARLRAAGAVLLGKTNTPTLASEPQTHNPLFGRTNNPWDLAHTPGGSSGGSAAAIAAGMTPPDSGSDLGGAVRIPAHFCGVFGLKPTTRRVSLAGHIPDLPDTPRFDRVLGAVGPLARSVEDLALVFGIIAGADGRDTEVPPLPVTDAPRPAWRDLRIAWAPTFPGVPVAADIRRAVEQLAAELDRTGARVAERLPDISWDEHHDLWARFYELFTYVLSAVHKVIPPPENAPAAPTYGDWMEMLQQRDRLIWAWERFGDQWDVLSLPPMPMTAFPHCDLGAPLAVDDEWVPHGRVSHHPFPFNLTGQPVAVLPLSRDRQGLPIGVQVVGRRWADERLLATAAQLTELTGPFRRPPGY